MQDTRSKTIEETQKIAEQFAETLKGSEVIALNGDLGAGKTTFVQFLGKKLGVSKNINSPTFVIMKIYPSTHRSIKNLVHIDAYRIESANDLEAIGASEYFGRHDSIVLVEWADKIKKILPSNTKYIKINEKEGVRHFHFSE